MSAQTVARWNAIPMERPQPNASEPSSLKRSRGDENDPHSTNNEDSDDDISIASRTPSPGPGTDGMDIDVPDIHKYDEYVRGPAREVVTTETKIKPTNIGFAMLAKMGWAEGQPVGLSGDGRVEPVPFTVKHDQTGLGKNTQDVEMIESTVAQRRELDSEKFARWTKDQKLKLQEDAARQAALQSTISSVLRPFYCELCDKQFKNVAQYDEHTNSYSHAHKARERDIKASMKVGGPSVDERKEKERKREEKEMRKLAKAQGIKIATKPATAGTVSVSVPVPVQANESSASTSALSAPEKDVKRPGWGMPSAPSSGWSSANVGSPNQPPPPAPALTSDHTFSSLPSAPAPAFRTGGWSSQPVGAPTAPPQAPPPAMPATSSASRSGWATVATPTATPMQPPTTTASVSTSGGEGGGWAFVSTLSSASPGPLPNSALPPSPMERPGEPGPATDDPQPAQPPGAPTEMLSASAPALVAAPQPAAPPKPKQDREQKRSGWQNFRAGKAGRR